GPADSSEGEQEAAPDSVPDIGATLWAEPPVVASGGRFILRWKIDNWGSDMSAILNASDGAGDRYVKPQTADDGSGSIEVTAPESEGELTALLTVSFPGRKVTA